MLPVSCPSICHTGADLIDLSYIQIILHPSIIQEEADCWRAYETQKVAHQMPRHHQHDHHRGEGGGGGSGNGVRKRSREHDGDDDGRRRRHREVRCSDDGGGGFP